MRAQLATTRLFLTPRTLAHESPSLRPVQEDPTWPARSWAGPRGAGLESVSLSLPPPSEWIRDYADSVPDPEALRVEVDTFMETYDEKMAEVGLPHGQLVESRLLSLC